MNNRLFSPRSLSLLLAALAGLITLVACGGFPASTEEVAATEAPATEAPSDSPTAVINPAATPTSEFVIPVTGGGDEPTPALLEFRRLTLEYPPVIKAGSGSDVIILTLDVDAQGNITATAQVEGNVTEGQTIEIPNLYATHNVTAESYYEVAGLEVSPPGSMYRPLKQGERVTFIWSVRAQDVGTYGGTIWLFLNFENRETGEKDRKEISAQIFDIKVVDLFGFSTNFVKTSGVVGSVLGSVVGFPFFKDIVKYLFERLTKGKKKSGKSKKKT
ncbi:MAG: hypothetical protein HYU84_07575 [Chloroflexi bacterium]|nr:hypothetical protein [Chloroflexota bacterium]MBI3167203.1 hypothetical protein [Chloroflexota bacterium]